MRMTEIDRKRARVAKDWVYTHRERETKMTASNSKGGKNTHLMNEGKSALYTNTTPSIVDHFHNPM